MGERFLIFWLIVFLPRVLLATDFYVSPAGNDDDSGSYSQPWRTIDRVNTQILRPGDSVSFEGGGSFTGKLMLNAEDSGLANLNPVRISSYGAAGRATLDAGSGAGLLAYNSAGFEISNLIFRGTGSTTNTGDGLGFLMDQTSTKLAYISLTDIEVTGFGGVGIYFGANTADHSGYTNIFVLYSEIHDNGRDGMFTWGTYTTASGQPYSHEKIAIRHSAFYRNTGIAGTNSGNGVYLKDVNGAVIEYCEAFENGTLGGTSAGGPVGIWALQSNDVTIQFNESHHNHSARTDGGGFDLDGGVTNSVMQYNYSHDNDGPGFLLASGGWARPFGGNRVGYNISENDARRNNGALTWYSQGSNRVEDTVVYNNTFYLSSGSGSALKQLGAAASSLRFHNNIIVTQAGAKLLDVPSTAGLIFQGNDYWSGGDPFAIRWGSSTYSSLSAWRDATRQEQLNDAPVGFQVDPLVVLLGNGQTVGEPAQLRNLAAYRLRGPSTLVDKGLDLDALFGIKVGTQDFYGNSLPQQSTYDLGAHERPTGSNEPPTLSVSPAWGPVVDEAGYVATLGDIDGLSDLGLFTIEVLYGGNWINIFPNFIWLFDFDVDAYGNYRVTLPDLRGLVTNLGPLTFRATLIDRAGPFIDQKMSLY